MSGAPIVYGRNITTTPVGAGLTVDGLIVQGSAVGTTKANLAFARTAASFTPIILTSSSPQTQCITGTIPQSLILPDVTTLPNGYQMSVINKSSQPMSVFTSTSTTVSIGATLPQTILNVVSTSAFPPAGTVYVLSGTGIQAVTYTGTSGGNSLTGCSGGAGAITVGDLVLKTLLSEADSLNVLCEDNTGASATDGWTLASVPPLVLDTNAQPTFPLDASKNVTYGLNTLVNGGNGIQMGSNAIANAFSVSLGTSAQNTFAGATGALNIGNNANNSTNVAGSVAIGSGAKTAGTVLTGISVGRNAGSSSSGSFMNRINFGTNANMTDTASGTNNMGIGSFLSSVRGGAFVGSGVNASNFCQSSLIGADVNETGYSTSSSVRSCAGGYNVLMRGGVGFGYQAIAGGGQSGAGIALGYQAQAYFGSNTATANNSIALGAGANATLLFDQGIALGSGASPSSATSALAISLNSSSVTTNSVGLTINGATRDMELYSNSVLFQPRTTSIGPVGLTNASSKYQYFRGSLAQDIYLPDASTMTSGTYFKFINKSVGGALTLNVGPQPTSVVLGTDISAAGVLNVLSTNGFLSSGALVLWDTSRRLAVTYTGKTGTTFTGCSNAPFAITSSIVQGTNFALAANGASISQSGNVGSKPGLTSLLNDGNGSYLAATGTTIVVNLGSLRPVNVITLVGASPTNNARGHTLEISANGSTWITVSGGDIPNNQVPLNVFLPSTQTIQFLRLFISGTYSPFGNGDFRGGMSAIRAFQALQVLNVTTTAGFISLGSFVTGGGVTTNTTVVSQLTGTSGGTGQYTLSSTQTNGILPTTISFYGPNVNTLNTVYQSLGVAATILPNSEADIICVDTTLASGVLGWYSNSNSNSTNVVSVSPTLPALIIPNNYNAGLKNVPSGGMYRSALNASITPLTFAITSSFVVTGTTLTVTATSGVIVPGMFLSGVPTATQIVSQLSGVSGSTGTYSVDVSQTAGVSPGGVTYSFTNPDWLFVKTGGILEALSVLNINGFGFVVNTQGYGTLNMQPVTSKLVTQVGAVYRIFANGWARLHNDVPGDPRQQICDALWYYNTRTNNGFESNRNVIRINGGITPWIALNVNGATPGVTRDPLQAYYFDFTGNGSQIQFYFFDDDYSDNPTYDNKINISIYFLT